MLILLMAQLPLQIICRLGSEVLHRLLRLFHCASWLVDSYYVATVSLAASGATCSISFHIASTPASSYCSLVVSRASLSIHSYAEEVAAADVSALLVAAVAVSAAKGSFD